MPNGPASAGPLLRATVEIAARRRLIPHRQGSLDALCGLVSIVNALRLALYADTPLTHGQCRALFAQGIEFLHRKHGLVAASIEGIGLRRRLALARYLALSASSSQLAVFVEQPDHSDWSSTADAFEWFHQCLAQRRPILASVEGGLEHYTAIAGMTPRTLLLFDSSDHQYLRKSRLGLRDGFYQMPPQGLFSIAIDRSE